MRRSAAPDALRPAPILADDDEAAQIELIEQRNEIGDVVRERQGSVDAGMVGIAGADPVGRDRAISGRGQRLR